MNDFKKEYASIRPEIDQAIKRVLKSGWYILGKEVESFEQNFAKYIGVKYCIGVANGLDALQISLVALGIDKGDEVITVSNTAVATVLAITNAGAAPVFVDVDEYYLMDVTKIEEKITAKTRAILPVHLFGQVANMQEIVKLAKKYKLKIVEDACQAHGAKQNGKMAGSFGDTGCFSFYPTKNLGAYGDGGAIVTNSKNLYEKAKKIRNYGQKNRYYHQVKGINSRLDEIQAAILNVKLNYLDTFVEKRNRAAEIYYTHLKDIHQINVPKIANNNIHAFHLFVIETEQRNGLMNYLIKHGVQSLIHYPIPVHKQECYPEFNNQKLIRTEKTAKRILSLPINPTLEKKEIIRVCEFIRKYFKG